MSFEGWESSKRITHICLLTCMILMVHKLGFKKLKRSSESWHILMLRRYYLDLTCCLKKLNTGEKILARDLVMP